MHRTPSEDAGLTRSAYLSPSPQNHALSHTEGYPLRLRIVVFRLGTVSQKRFILLILLLQVIPENMVSTAFALVAY